MSIQIMRLLFSVSCFIALAVVSKGQTPSNVDNEIGGSQVCGNWVAEVYFLINNSRRIRDDFEFLKVQASEIMREVISEMPGSTVGFGVFSDKYFIPFHLRDTPDYLSLLKQYPNMCYDHKLRLTDNITEFTAAVNRVELAWGPTPYESTYDAILHSMTSDSVGWSTGSHDANGRQILRLLFVFTKFLPRMAGDGKLVPSSYGLHLKDHEDNKEVACHEFDYPSEDQIVETFKAKNIHPMFMVSSDDPAADDVSEIQQHRMVKQHWAQLNEKIDNGGSVVDLKTSSANFLDVIKQGLKTVSCSVPTTPTITTRSTDKDITDVPVIDGTYEEEDYEQEYGHGNADGENDNRYSQRDSSQDVEKEKTTNNTAVICGSVGAVAVVGALAAMGLKFGTPMGQLPPMELDEYDYDDDMECNHRQRELTARFPAEAFL